MAKIIGIDLGTTNSCVAVMEGGEPVVITNSEGARTTPSVVSFQANGERLVGQIAKRQAITNPEHTIISIKREMGTDHKTKIDDKTYSPQEISAMILQKIKADAEAYFDQKIIDYIAETFKAEYGIDLRNDKSSVQRLKEAAEKAKIELSSSMQTNINLPFITADATGPKHIDMNLTRAKFNELTHDLVQRSIEPMKKALSDAGLSISQGS